MRRRCWTGWPPATSTWCTTTSRWSARRYTRRAATPSRRCCRRCTGTSAKHPDFYPASTGRGRVLLRRCVRVPSSPGRTRRCAGRRSARCRWPPRCRPSRPRPAAGHLLGLGRLTAGKGLRPGRPDGPPAGPAAGAGRAGRPAGGPAALDPSWPTRRTRPAGCADVRYFRTEVEPHLGEPGALGRLGRRRRPRPSCCAPPGRWCSRCAGTSRAAPRWSRRWPAGVPVVGMRRGALTELVDHGVTGWLADDEHEFAGVPAAGRRAGPGRPAGEWPNGASRRTMAGRETTWHVLRPLAAGPPGS